LTVRPINISVKSYENNSKESLQELIVCGGGAFNADLVQRLQALLPHLQVVASAACGLPPQDVEATAFAWLARLA
jgi:anhydro-N-acetylmuramic acid kinase